MGLLLLTTMPVPHSTGPTPQSLGDARQHPGGDHGGVVCGRHAGARLLDTDDAVSRLLLQRCVFHVVPNMNPDGSGCVATCANAAGANLNREWAAPPWSAHPKSRWCAHARCKPGWTLCRTCTVTRSRPTTCGGLRRQPCYTERVAVQEDASSGGLDRQPPDLSGHPPLRARCTRCGLT